MNEYIDLFDKWGMFVISGFSMNLLVACSAVAIGTSLGMLLHFIKVVSPKIIQRFINVLLVLLRSTPTLILIFYLAIIMPDHFVIPFTEIDVMIPLWLKAAIALSASPLGFTAWNIEDAHKSWKDGNKLQALSFIPNWVSSFTITLLASSVSSLVGVSEILSKANTVVAATDSSVMLPIYLFVAVFFVGAASIMTLVSVWLKSTFRKRLAS